MPDVILQIINATHFKWIRNQIIYGFQEWSENHQLVPVNFYPLIKDATVNNVSLWKGSSVNKQQHWRTATMINLVQSSNILAWATARSYVQKQQKQSTKIFIGHFRNTWIYANYELSDKQILKNKTNASCRKEIQTILKWALPTSYTLKKQSDKNSRWWAHLAFKEYIPDRFLSRNGQTMWVTDTKQDEENVVWIPTQ